MKRLFYLISLLWGVILTACLTQPTAVTSNVNPPETADWLTYTNEYGGYTFQYPPDVRFSEVKSGENQLGYSYMVFVVEKTAINIEISTLKNPNQLLLSDFIRTEKAVQFLQPSDKWPVPEAEPYLKATKIQDNLEIIEVEQSKATWPLTRVCRYMTYIAHQDLVITVSICPGGRNPLDDDWYPPQEAIIIYRKILDSIVLNPR